jgi:DNA-binding MurR/RpiR family transcriptional regulator
MIDGGYDIEAVVNTQFFDSKVSMATKKDLNIFLSFSGNTDAIKTALELSLDLDIPTVLITQNDRHTLKERIPCYILLPFFKEQENHLVLDSQIIIHGFVGILINYLMKNEEVK